MSALAHIGDVIGGEVYLPHQLLSIDVFHNGSYEIFMVNSLPMSYFKYTAFLACLPYPHFTAPFEKNTTYY